MTSTGNPQKSNQAPTTAAPSAPSYASAAGASKKPGSIVASGPNPSPPVAVGSSASSSSNAKPTSASPVNGRPSIPPAVPAVPSPVAASSAANGGAKDQNGSGSVTILPHAPTSTYSANGGPVGGSNPLSNIQFGYSSPHLAHNTPQPGASAPISIPDNSAHPRIPSPRQSPSPIPQPSASGGRPPSSLHQTGDVKPQFGSYHDPERHMRSGSMQANNPALQQHSGMHNRHPSNMSMSSTGDMPTQPMTHNRGGYHGNRGGRNYNPNPHHYNPNAGGYQQHQHQPGNYGNGRARNNMPAPFQPQAGRPYSSSPQPSRASPHIGTSHPSTPQMNQAIPNMSQATPPYSGFAGPMTQPPNMTGFPPQFPGQFGAPMGHMGYNYNTGMPYAAQPNTSAFNAPYNSGAAFHPAAASAMSRTPSSTEKPPATVPTHGQPMVVGVPNQSPGQQLPIYFERPKGIPVSLKTPDGSHLDFTGLGAPASPSRSAQHSNTPPNVPHSSTPPTKPSTPAHGRTDSQAPNKSAKEIQDELRQKIAKVTSGQAANGKEDEVAKAAASAEEDAKAAAETKRKAEEKAAEEARLKEEQKAKEEQEAKAAEEAKLKAEAEAAAAKEKAEAEAAAAKAKAEAEAEAKKKREEEEELERMIREMEEEDRRREEQAAKYAAEKAAKAAVEKEEADKRRAVEAAENDRKLREQEREMERLEEEKERRAKENAAAGLSVADLLAQSRTGAPAKEPEVKVDAVADKMANMTLGSGDSKPATPTSASGSKTSEKGRKPAALNLSVNTKSVEAPQPSAALQALKTSRFLTIKESMDPSIYSGTSIASPNPALNPATFKRGQTFKYDANFLLQFQNVFTEQPSVEFSSQVKSLIGDGDGNRSASARTPATAGGRGGSRPGGFPTGGAMGAFSQARTLPPGTTSAERLAMSQGAMPRPQIGSGMSFGPGAGTFPRSGMMGQMARQPSNSGINPNSPRTGSRPGRGGSHRSGYHAKEAQAAKTMPLTQGQEVKALQTSSTGWKPTSVGRGTAAQQAADGHMDPKMVQRKVQAALNKMTPENFEKISQQILAIANQSKNENDGRTLRQVIQLTFEKATDEPHFSTTYAKFCKRMLDQMSSDIKDDAIKDKHGNVVSGGNLFRKYLLNRCQEDFEKGWSVPEASGDSKQPAAALMTEEYYAAAAVKRRGLGLVRFIGELFKLGMLTERIIHGCIHSLVDYKDEPKEAEIESLCYLLKTVGAQLDSSDKGSPMMSAYFERIQKMIELPNLENRLKFMLMDVRDIRNNGWRSKEANKGPKTLDEVRAEAEAAAAAKAQEAARSNIRGGGGRPAAGRGGDSRAFSAGYNQTSNTVGMDDLRRLKSGSRNAGPITLGPHSMLASRSNSGRRGGPGGTLGRTGEDSGMSSRTGTPPTNTTTHTNAYGLLANLESENPASPPSTAASPSMSKVTPESSGDKKD